MATAYLTPGVYVEEVDRGTKPIEGVGTAVAAFLGIAEKGPIGKATMIANWTQFTNIFGGYVPGAYLAHAVFGYFNNGGGLCYVVRIGDASAEAAQPVAELPAKSGTATIKALPKPGVSPDGLSVEVSGDDDSFTITVKGGGAEEKFEGLTLGKGAKNAFDVVNKQSTLVQLEELKVTGLSLTERAPAPGTYPLALPSATTAFVPVTPSDYQGDVTDRSGLGGLEAVSEVTMVLAPDVMAAYQAGILDMDGVKAIQLAMIAHAERMGDRVAILDTPPDLNAQEAQEWRMNTAGYDSKYAALYYPWVTVADPTPNAPTTTITVPPSGHMAGVWARSDNERGVHKAPANEVIRGVISLPINLTNAEQGVLNPNGVNCLRVFAGRGIRVWGARTLSSDPSWRYLNVRRLFNFVEKSIEQGTQWAVFEPNDQDLWGKMRRDIGAFLRVVWRSGALFGTTPDQAFFVKCDEENNPQETRDLGQLYVDIGIAPVKPAEFVIFRIGQYAPEQ
ncbi:MAG: phage tail sheath family protein [Dehalococcoidia bacterium]